ncbi:hypothetical protein [Flavobacterium sp.]|uniref:hypothetical protein n=1 Tax=Flavobacterium sp. TaxID=239 RepID=UPI0025BCDFF8|nr:hypothetical protein [Flavobacterium sp.]MBA4155398.1 hypothetical protein [Flavobacterium sp.]
MNGTEFYEFLRANFLENGIPLNANNVFYNWLYKVETDSYSFQFTVLNNGNKSITKEVIIISWDANVLITNNWLLENLNINYHGDCRIGVLKHLIYTFNHLR